MDTNDTNLAYPTQESESRPEFEIRGAEVRERAGLRTEFTPDNAWRRRLSRTRRPMALSHRCGQLS